MRKALALTVAVTALLSCRAVTARFEPTPTSESTRTSTSAPEPTASLTPPPTSTWRPAFSAVPTLAVTLGATLTPSPTIVRPAPSSTRTPAGPLGCRLVWQSPRDGVEVVALRKFSTGWKLMNTGTAAWDPGSVEFVYLSGAKLHNDPVVRLTASVPPGESDVLTVPMRAPLNSTRYSTYWSLRQVGTYFCRVGLWIYVK